MIQNGNDLSLLNDHICLLIRMKMEIEVEMIQTTEQRMKQMMVWRVTGSGCEVQKKSMKVVALSCVLSLILMKVVWAKNLLQ